MAGAGETKRRQSQESTFISERVKDLAIMYLTRRSDLQIKWQDDGSKWLDCVVEITGKGKPSRRVFGVELKGTMSRVTDDHANKVLRFSMQSMLVAVHRCSTVALPRSSRASTDTTGRPLVFQATVPGLCPLRAA